MSNPLPTPTPIPQSAPAGGLTIIHPPQTATSFYKIEKDHPITFIWNFTSLLATPTHLTVTAVGENGNSYPVGPATDGVIPGTQTEVVWDVYSYNQAHRATPLVQQRYQLQIWDERGPGAPIAPGRLSPNSALKFAMYDPAKYTSMADGEFYLQGFILNYLLSSLLVQVGNVRGASPELLHAIQPILPSLLS
jgi:hypothetical protein